MSTKADTSRKNALPCLTEAGWDHPAQALADIEPSQTGASWCLKHLINLPAILGCKVTDLLPDSVVTDYARARARHDKLDRTMQFWPELPLHVKETLVFVAEGAKGEEVR